MPEFYNPSGETQKHGVNLPHWQQNEVIQFVTFRLADSMPQAKLRDPAKREFLEQTLMHDQGSKANHHIWVIMPNHVHLLFTPSAPWEKLMQSWKGISSRRIGLGSLWQKNYRDTLIRDASHFANAVRYIRINPAKLQEGTFTLWQSERARQIR